MRVKSKREVAGIRDSHQQRNNRALAHTSANGFVVYTGCTASPSQGTSGPQVHLAGLRKTKTLVPFSISSNLEIDPKSHRVSAY